MAPTCLFSGGRLSKETMTSVFTFVWETAAPPALAGQLGSSLYVPSAFQATPPALELRVSEFK